MSNTGSYQEYRASIPCAQCKFYWSEIEYPETPREKVGKYGLIIEYLGDDLKVPTVTFTTPYTLGHGLQRGDIHHTVLKTATYCRCTTWWRGRR